MPSLAQLGERISAWTTRLVLSALVLLAGWGFGRQVMEWWAAEPAGDPGQGPAAALPEAVAAREPQLALSDGQWVMTWQGVAASREEALGMLRARCRPLVADAPWPAQPPGPAEQRLLALLADARPIAEQPGRWGLYQQEGALDLVVGTRLVGAATQAGPGAAPSQRRVVVWGLAVPHGPHEWALYAFYPAR